MQLPVSAASAAIALLALASAQPASAAPFFSTGNPNGLMATATRPESAGAFEIESADDFVLSTGTSITSATFTGLIPVGVALSDVKNVVVEIYRVFPADSNVGRTSGPPTFSTSQVPTRVNSPSDVAFDSRDSSSGLSFTVSQLAASFTASNSVQPGGIHPLPGITTGGNGPVTGQEVEIDATFSDPFSLPADHYFFVPQVELNSGDFLWLSAPRPISRRHRPARWRSPELDPRCSSWIRTGCGLGRTSSAAPRSRLSTRRSRSLERRYRSRPVCWCWEPPWWVWDCCGGVLRRSPAAKDRRSQYLRIRLRPAPKWLMTSAAAIDAILPHAVPSGSGALPLSTSTTLPDLPGSVSRSRR